MTSETAKAKKSQLDKFKEVAREHEANEDEAHWDENLKRIVRTKPAPPVFEQDSD